MRQATRRQALATLILPALLPVTAVRAQAAWPSRPVRIVVPFPAGGMADALARGFTQPLQAALGQPVIIENRPGAGTVLGADNVAKSPADGHTLLMATDATLSISPLVYAKLPFDPVKDFTPVMTFANTVECVLVNASFPANSIAELVQVLKANPGKYNFGSFGRGSNAHLSGEAFRMATGTDITHIPYKGVAEAIPALLTNEVAIVFTAQFAALQHIQAGKIKALAVMTDKRQATLPNVPTIAEAGYPDLQQKVWFGFVAPANTPRAVIDRLNRELTVVATSAAFREKVIESHGLESLVGTPTQFAEILRVDREKYPKQVKAAGIVPE